MSDQSLPQIISLPSRRVKDLAGERSGRLVVLGYVGNNPHQQTLWLCRCDCGSYVTLSTVSLNPNRPTLSCGCLANELTSNRKKVHGFTKSNPEYRAWCAMRTRCNNPNTSQYRDYGGRGIKVCDRWSDFLVFLADMGPKPTPDHSLDRIDVNGDYCPENCRWATRLQQNNNARSNWNITFQGETMTISQWSKRVGINEGTLYNRIAIRHLPAEIALTMPVNRKAVP